MESIIIAASSVPCSQQTYDLTSIISKFQTNQNYPQIERLEVNFSPKLITLNLKMAEWTVELWTLTSFKKKYMRQVQKIIKK